MSAVLTEARRWHWIPCRVTGSCELNNMVAGNQIWVLRKSSKRYKLMNHFSSPLICFYIYFYLSREGSVIYHDIYIEVKEIVGISSFPSC